MLPRLLEPKVRAALADTPAVFLHGGRQTGKSTLAQNIALSDARTYITLDDATSLAAAFSDPDGFLRSLPARVVIDEVQRAPQIFRALKAEIDRDRTPGRFLLTGSANALVLPAVGEYLAGRVEVLTLWPLAQSEIENAPGSFIDSIFAERFVPPSLPPEHATDLNSRISRGGFPEPFARHAPDRRAAWFSSYLSTILQRNVRELSGIDRIAELPRLLALVAARTSGLLNIADLSRGLSIPNTSLSRYLALLQATFLVHTLEPWHNNPNLRLTKSPKVFLSDTGLACHLLGIDADRLATNPIERGPLIENFIAMEVLKHAGWSSIRAQLRHFRTSDGREVDLVLEDPSGRLCAVECKSAASITSSDFRGLRAFQQAVGGKFRRAIILYAGSKHVAFDERTHALPHSALWARWSA